MELSRPGYSYPLLPVTFECLPDFIPFLCLRFFLCKTNSHLYIYRGLEIGCMSTKYIKVCLGTAMQWQIANAYGYRGNSMVDHTLFTPRWTRARLIIVAGHTMLCQENVYVIQRRKYFLKFSSIPTLAWEDLSSQLFWQAGLLIWYFSG